MAISVLQQVHLNDNSSPLSVADITISAGTDRLMLLISINQTTGTSTSISSATFGGVNLTQAGLFDTATQNGDPNVYFGYLLDADIPTGSQTAAVTWSAGGVRSGYILVLEGVDQTTPVITFTGSRDTTTDNPATLNFGSVDAGNIVVLAGTALGTTPPVAIPSGYTATSTASWGSTAMQSSGAYKIMGSTGSETPDFDFTGLSGAVSQVGVSLQQAASENPGLRTPVIYEPNSPSTVVNNATDVRYIVRSAVGEAEIVDAATGTITSGVFELDSDAIGTIGTERWLELYWLDDTQDRFAAGELTVINLDA